MESSTGPYWRKARMHAPRGKPMTKAAQLAPDRPLERLIAGFAEAPCTGFMIRSSLRNRTCEDYRLLGEANSIESAARLEALRMANRGGLGELPGSARDQVEGAGIVLFEG